MKRVLETLGWDFEDDPEPFSTVNIYCEDGIKEEVASYFSERFEDRWQEARQAFESEHQFEPEEDEASISVSVEDYGVCVSIASLDLSDGLFEIVDPFYGIDALEGALADTKEEYSDIEYRGYYSRPWRVSSGGQIVQREISSTGKQAKGYDFIGKRLNSSIKDGDWNGVPDEEYDPVPAWLDSGSTSFLDLLSHVPTEEEEEWLYFLYAHSEWIEKDVLRSAVNTVIDAAADADPEKREILSAYVKKLESGEIFKAVEKWLQACNDAEEYEKELEENHYHPEVEWWPFEDYAFVRAKAREGDTRAKEILEKVQVDEKGCPLNLNIKMI